MEFGQHCRHIIGIIFDRLRLQSCDQRLSLCALIHLRYCCKTDWFFEFRSAGSDSATIFWFAMSDLGWAQMEGWCFSGCLDQFLVSFDFGCFSCCVEAILEVARSASFRGELFGYSPFEHLKLIFEFWFAARYAAISPYLTACMEDHRARFLWFLSGYPVIDELWKAAITTCFDGSRPLLLESSEPLVPIVDLIIYLLRWLKAYWLVKIPTWALPPLRSQLSPLLHKIQRMPLYLSIASN